MISRILVPTDGSKAAEKAAAYAIDLAKRLNATVIILSVVDRRALYSIAETAVPVAVSAAEIESNLKKAAKIYVKEISKLCRENGVKSKAVVTKGHPVDEIVKEAERTRVNLIVMGSHGRSALTATILGSIAYGVIHKDTKIPVTVVKE